MKRVFYTTTLLLLLSIPSWAQLKIQLERRTTDTDARMRNEVTNEGFFSVKDMVIDTKVIAGTNLAEDEYNFANLQYFGNVTVGSPAQTLTVIFDTGSDILYLPGADCAKCHGTNKFSCKNSSTCYQTNTTLSRSYGIGQIGGHVAYDQVGLNEGPKVLYPFSLGSTDGDMSGYVADGILGLSNDDGTPNFVDLAYEAGYIEDKVFYFDISFIPNISTKHFVTTDSYISFGDLPEDKVNDLVWLPITLPNYWATDILGMEVAGKKVDISSDPNAGRAVFDTGTSPLILADGVYKALVDDLLANECFDGCQGSPSKICCPKDNMDKYPNVTVYTRGLKIVMTPDFYLFPSPTNETLCNAVIDTAGTLMGKGLGFQIFGDGYLRNNFVAFSKRNQTVGILGQHNVVLYQVPNDSNFWAALATVVILAVALLVVQLIQIRMGASKKDITQPILSQTYQL